MLMGVQLLSSVIEWMQEKRLELAPYQTEAVLLVGEEKLKKNSKIFINIHLDENLIMRKLRGSSLLFAVFCPTSSLPPSKNTDWKERREQ